MKKLLAMSLLFLPVILFSQIPMPYVVKCSFMGDMMIGTTYPTKRLPPNDGKTYFNGVKPYLAGRHVVFGNLEGAITKVAKSPKNVNRKRVYAFKMPLHYINYFKDAGFNVLNVANNHALDFGIRGNQETINIVKSKGMVATGEKNKLAIIEKNGIKIGFLGYSWYNQFNNLLDISSAKKLVAESKSKVDVLIVTFHGGAEGVKAAHVPSKMEYFYKTPRGNLRAFAHAVVDSGADVVIGHGPHLLRGVEKYKGKIIAYSLGNFATYGSFSLGYPLNITAILNLDITKSGTVANGEIIPFILKNRGIPQYDSKKQAIGIMNRLSKSDFKQPVLFDKDGKLIL